MQRETGKMKKILRDSRGFTLVELMIVVAVSGVLMGSLYSAYRAQQKVYTAQESVAEMQQNLRAAMSVMSTEMRMAGYDPNGDGGIGIVSANPTVLSFSFYHPEFLADNDDNDGDGAIDEADEDVKIILYDLSDVNGDGANDIGYQIGADVTTKVPIAERIDNMEFNYLDNTGSTTADINDIRWVQVSMLARARQSDRDFTNNTTYTAGSGATWVKSDNFRRRMSITTVKLRNIGL